MNAGELFDPLAVCIGYPDHDVRAAATACIATLERAETAGTADPDMPDRDSRLRACEALRAFLDAVRDLSVSEMEELYTRTFDINPVCSLEIGWHLYGEQYARGAFLVTMRELLRLHAIPESSELPDHLSHVLLVLGRMEEPDRRRFAERSVVPALVKMRDGIARVDNPYRHLLGAVETLVRAASHQPEGVTA